MSLKFVVKKLEGHSLQEEDQSSSKEPKQDTSLQKGAEDQTTSASCQQEKLNDKSEKVDDSGTESDDETDLEAGVDADASLDEEDDMEVVDSGVGLNTRSAGKVGGKSSLLPQLRRKEQMLAAKTGFDEASSSLAAACTLDTAVVISMDDTDNHSSEEELEDIIGENRKVYVSETVVHHKVLPGHSSQVAGDQNQDSTGVGDQVESPAVKGAGGVGLRSGAGGSGSISVCTVEKRKWSQVDQGSSGSSGGPSSRTGSGSSGDEEVSGYMGCSTTPVQFCTSPPLNVYKPRRSQSPPPKLFHLAAETPTATTNLLKGNTKVLTGAFRPGGGSGAILNIPPFRGGGEEGEEETDGDRSPHKRHRSTPRPLARQRPCLDFEKMRQIKTKVVTSWRQGTELSLFCW